MGGRGSRSFKPKYDRRQQGTMWSGGFWKGGGRIRYVDAQIHDTNVNIAQRMARTDTNSVNLVRTDNLRVSERMRNFVEPRRRK